MKMFCSKTAKTVLFFSLICGAADASAQKINEDLQPQAPKTTPKKTTKTTPTPIKKKPVRVVKRSTKPPTNNTPPVTTTTTTIAPVTNNSNTTGNTTQVATPPVNTSPVVVQTPAEILQRFMNFQQSEGVTLKDWESVVAQANAALQANPSDTTARAQLFVAQGQIAFLRADYSNALIQFNAAADALPASALPPYGIGQVYLATKQPNEAEEAFQKAIKIDKNFALAYKGMGDSMTAQKKTKRAQDYYKDAARIGLSNAGGVTQNNPAVNQNTTAQMPNTQPATPYETELNDAKKMTVRKKWQASLDKLNGLSKTYPTAPEIYIAIGENYMGLRQFLSAQQAFRKATEVSPNSAVGFFKLGSVLFELNEFQAASEALEKSLILDQQGTTINRSMVRKMADRASERAKESKEGKKKFLGIG